MADAGALRDGNGAFCGGGATAAGAPAAEGCGGGGGTAAARGSDGWKEWDDAATGMLLDLYTERYLALQRGTLRAKEWQEVVDGLNARFAAGKPIYSYNRCKNKIDSLKKTFKTFREKRKMGAPLKWKWYNRIEKISSKGGGASGGGGGGETAADGGGGKRMKVSAEGFVEQEFAMGAEEVMPIEDAMMLRPFGMRLLEQQAEDQQAQQQEEEHRWMPEAGKCKKKRDESGLREIAQMLIDALERTEERRQQMEERRMEVMREIQAKRTETQLQIARMIIECGMQHHHQG